jgi:hypothetical protein
MPRSSRPCRLEIACETDELRSLCEAVQALSGLPEHGVSLGAKGEVHRGGKGGYVHTLAVVFTHVHWIDWITRSPMLHIEEMSALTAEHGFPFFLAQARAYHARELSALGRAKEGLALGTQALADFRATGASLTTICHIPQPSWLR